MARDIIKPLMTAAIFAATATCVFTAQAAEDRLPAVSGFNALVSAQVGVTHPPDRVENGDTNFRQYLNAAIVVPLDLDFSPDAYSPFGIKFSGTYVTGDGADSLTGQISPIWRDPALGFVAPYVQFEQISDSSPGSIEDEALVFGVSVGAFIGDFTFRLRAQRREGDHNDHDFGRIEATYYPIDNMNFSLGYNFLDVDIAGSDLELYSETLTARAEWMIVSDGPTGLSLVVRGGRSFEDSEGSYSVFTGFRVFMGPEAKPLKRRQREDMF